jgi:hypothetical protein
MKNVTLTIVAVLSSFSLWGTSLHATATETKCDKNGWEKSPASKYCKGATFEEDPYNRRTCYIKNAVCNGVPNGKISMQPHQFPDLNVCFNYLYVGACTDLAPLDLHCKQNWQQSSAFKSNACIGTVNIDPYDTNMCLLKMTCIDINNKSINNHTLTFTPSEVSQLNVCAGLLKTGVCKSK